ncbi:DUF6124 family protein [Pseudomonas jessenii]|uniref:DUF6124 family protein n=1 Tax=Pseudomonas jessenii TaxID=77298 RepID=UPI0032E466A9
MFKVTPDPPDNDSCPNPAAHIMATPHKPSTLFTINPDINTETLLAHACESLASASVMANDLAGFLEGTHRNTLLGIAQVIMLGELAVSRALDQVDRPG